ncbi:sucrose phosphorylase [Georgenia thermotolerans]|uniref:Sucrose phosphorylase n=1 Tax=Georgenia thermotolerans TaxID=527326 RepID=A0A7J5ULC2_9MICO|nr:sucrose phosphorylase [Georgenia thermotolerans]KAE8763071.1 sucrose phosphorylase [Georgenia thermotolerans]
MDRSHEVQLIAYADRFGGSLAGLRAVLDGPLRGVFTGVHVLPFYTPFDGADAGFDPVDHASVDPRLGDWDDVRRLAGGYTVMADLIVNHVSADSAEFRDVVARGDASPAAGMFLTMSDVYPDGADEEELTGIYRPRPGLPFTAVTLGGRRRLVWTTFTDRQIDLNLAHPAGQAHLARVLAALAGGGVRDVRLDAVGYAVKTAGTSSFMTPHTLAFIDDLTAQARALGMEVLVEVHSHFERQIEIARRVDRVYDFALPPLLLHALFTGDAAPLRRWLQIRPANAVTVLDTHDGIGVVDVGPDQIAPDRPGLLTPDQLDALVEGIHARSGGQSRQATGWAASNVDVYQVNCTYYDALGADDDAYLLARAVQLFTPGIPQIYYVGLLAGHNDMDRLARTGVGREINRHHYGAEEIVADLRRPVVRRLLELIALRRTHPAFGGTCAVTGDGGHVVLTWRHGEHVAALNADVAAARFTISTTPAPAAPPPPAEDPARAGTRAPDPAGNG